MFQKFPNSNTTSFYLIDMLFEIAPKIAKYLGYY